MARIRAVFDRIYWALVHWIAPGLLNAQRKYLEGLLTHVRQDGRWLDLGCGCRVVPQWLPEAGRIQAKLDRKSGVVVGVDCDEPSLSRNVAIPSRVLGRIARLPFADSAFDLITANMVMEHTENPERILSEIHRVLQPNGVFLFQTPNLFNPFTLMAIPVPQGIKNVIVRFLHDRAPEDVFPTFYRLNRVRTIEKLARRTSLCVQQLNLVESSAETLMLGPLVIFELLFIRLTRLHALRWLRSDIIAVLRKPDQVSEEASETTIAGRVPERRQLSDAA